MPPISPTGHFTTSVIHDAQFHARQRRADGAPRLTVFRAAGVGCEHGGFAHAVAFQYHVSRARRQTVNVSISIGADPR